MSTPYIVSARKYRPSTFRSVVGQPSLTMTLKNAIESDRLAQAYLFCGPRGVGKTSCARIFAKTINCEHPTADGEACNECESCRAFNEGRSINIVELDAASNNGVDNIRTLNEQVRVPPQSGRYRVFIIDEVHMLSVGAFNAFLKTLEEPPKYVIFILATTEKHKVLPTILSRCQIYDFNRIGVNDIAEHLAYVAESEGVEAEPSALGVIARKADGAMRDALSIFDQVSASCRGHITYQGTIDNLNVLDYEFYFRLTEAFLSGDVPGALLIYKEVRDKGFDSLSFVNGLGTHVRELMVAASEATLPLLEVSADVAERYRAQAVRVKPRWAYAAMEAVNYCDLNYRTSGNKQFLVELTLIRLCQLSDPSGAAESKGMPPRQALREPAQAKAGGRVESSGRQTGGDRSQVQAGSEVRPAAARAVQQSPARVEPGAATTPRATAAGLPGTPAAAKGRPKLMRISVGATAAEPEEPSYAPSGASAPEVAADAGTPVSAERLLESWKSFTEEHPDRQLLNATMRSCQPQATGEPGRFLVLVDNPGQLRELEDSMGLLLPYLRTQTGSGAIELEVKVDEHGERPRVLTRREAFERLLEENDGMRRILGNLGATMVD